MDRDFQDGEVKAVAVRGCTPKEGLNVKVIVRYGYDALPKFSEWKLRSSEEGSCDFHLNRIFSELMIRRRRVQVVTGNSNERMFFGESASSIGHYYLSRRFKPELTLFLNIDKRGGLVSQNELDLMLQRSLSTGEDQTIDLQVIADGSRAYVKRI